MLNYPSFHFFGTFMRFINHLLISLFFLFSGIGLAAPLSTSSNAIKNLHLDWVDENVTPESNFFAFANGTWQKKNPIPPDYARWGTIQVLEEQNQDLIHRIVQACANSANKKNDLEQKIGDFYLSGMDEKMINKLGVTPLQSEFDRIQSIQNLKDLQKIITHLQIIGVDALFKFTSMQDFKDSRLVIGVALQSGLGLPDREFYLAKNEKFNQIRTQYLKHIAKMFELLGDTRETAVQNANTVMRIETNLARASMSLTEQRNPYAIYHLKNLKQLAQTTPSFSWPQYFKQWGYPQIHSINLAQPLFFKEMNRLLNTISLSDWKIYLRWHLIQTFADFLSHPFVEEDFQMAQVLTGAKQLLPRWKRVISVEQQVLGFAIGKIYVEKTFSPAAKKKAQQILSDVRSSLRKDLQHLTWMSDKTRQAAIKKLDLMEARTGYPDKWRDYSGLVVDRGPYVLNVIRGVKFLNHYQLNKIGKPVNKNDWDMTPQTVNAYYDPSMNRLNIPAGILQPPFFSLDATATVNYGGIGTVIGHEMTHGFDDQGAQFDGQGNLKNWWTAKDLAKFRAATECIAQQFSHYTVNGDIHVKGKLVMGEATADLGGLILAYNALHRSNEYKKATSLSTYTPDQQFFLSFAHLYATNILPALAQSLVVTNPHPPAIYRVNGTLANMEQFKENYHLSPESKMLNSPLCKIW